MQNNFSQWCEIDLTLLDHNVTEIKRVLGGTKVMGVVKANAYGHGLVEIGKRLDVNESVFCLGVNSIQEGISLREAGVMKPIVVMGYIDQQDYSLVLENDLEIVLTGMEMLDSICNLQSAICNFKIHIKVDTGLNRLGFFLDELNGALEKIKNSPNIEVVGLMSHLSALEEGYLDYTQKQIDDFSKAGESFTKKGFHGIKHIGAASSLLAYKNAYFDMVRVGISLYGLWPSKETRRYALADVDLKPILSFKTKIIFTKKVAKGGLIGYGGSFTACRDTLIGIIPTGYYEGLDRRLSNRGIVLVGGKRAPIIGRVCMNMAFVDLTDVGGVEIGDEVPLFGKDDGEEITAEEFTARLGTVPHELTTKIPEFVPRVYKN